MLDEPVSSAKDHGVPSAWRAQRISPRGVCRSSTKSMACSTTGHIDSTKPRSSVSEPVVPHAGGDVGADVGVELVLLDPVGHVVLVPGAVGALEADQPLVGPLGLGDAAADGERHGRLDVVPRVGVAAGEPGDHAVGQLPLGDAVDGCRAAARR